jgi:hypothetical protein
MPGYELGQGEIELGKCTTRYLPQAGGLRAGPESLLATALYLPANPWHIDDLCLYGPYKSCVGSPSHLSHLTASLGWLPPTHRAMVAVMAG